MLDGLPIGWRLRAMARSGRYGRRHFPQTLQFRSNRHRLRWMAALIGFCSLSYLPAMAALS